MSRRDDAPRDLLFGLLALQNGLVTRDQLVLAFGVWTGAAGRPLADLLTEQGAFDAPGRALLDTLVDAHLKLHGGDTEKSLAALAVSRSTRESLAAAGSEVEATLAHVAFGSAEPGLDDTVTFSVGSASSDGQRFRVLRLHARGGLGAVFVAFDEELNREVALKQILDDRADDPTIRQRFVAEAEITGGLEHPGVVPVYGLGTYGGGRPYYAMRFIKGDSLKEAVEQFHGDDALKSDPGRRSLALRKLLRRFLDVCNAIDYAHSRGVIHRDLKPSNIIVGKHGETLVVDWGLAKAVGKSGPGAATDERTLVPSSASGAAETLPGSALGTPAYMSPEQAAGDLDRLGPRSDVYSLGATLYCLLTGKPPFEREDVGEILLRVRRGEFPRPRQVDQSIDRALEAVCLKAMATESAGRYSSCRALAEDVERWMADEPVSAYREPSTARARRWTRKHRTAVTGAATSLVMALAAVTAGLVVVGGKNRLLDDTNAKLSAALGAEVRAGNEAQTSARLAQRRETEAREQTDIANRRLYGVNMVMLRRAHDDGDMALFRRLLDEQRSAAGTDHRGFEWRYWARRDRASATVWRQPFWITCTTFSADGEWLAVGSPDHTVTIRSVRDGTVRKTLKTREPIFSVSLSPDGRWCAAASGNSLEIWGMADGRRAASFQAIPT
jgi:serine/threonine protein kinase